MLALYATSSIITVTPPGTGLFFQTVLYALAFNEKFVDRYEYPNSIAFTNSFLMSLNNLLS